MLPLQGPLVGAADVTPEAWVAALGPRRAPLALAPGSPDGWFGGLGLVACDPCLEPIRPRGAQPYGPPSSFAHAGAVLERAMGASGPVLAAVLLRYGGRGAAGVFRRGIARTAEGWRCWGDWSDAPLPQPAEVRVPLGTASLVASPRSSMSREAYVRAVEQAREAMRAGDLYVLNLCRRVSGRCTVPAAEAFAALRLRTGAAMGAFWALPGRALLSASPERFIRLERDLLVVEPVKGTRPRRACPACDARLVRELRSCPKERAEHVMVVDLERNDLGRVCVAGSVIAAPLMHVASTPYCHQMVSRVGGLLARGTSLADVLASTFPCGSVTGAPKVSAMEHIARLERGGREEYTGSLLVAMPGRLDSSVLIRTAIVARGRLSYGVGCGITVDSDPSAEWEETLVKTRPLLGGTFD